MRKLIVGVLMAVLLHGSPASADLNTFIERCGSQDSSARDVINFCQRALQSGGLDDRTAAQVRANLGVGFFEIGDYRSALVEYNQAVAAAPDIIGIYLNRARVFERLGDLRSAAQDYAFVLQRDPRAADAHLGRGAMLLANGDPGRALDDFSRAVALQPDWVSPYFNRGMSHYQLGMWREAVSDFTEVLKRSPRDAAAYLNRGRALAQSGRAEAGRDFDRAIEIDPEWGGAWFARGQYWDANGNREAANRDFIRAYELGYPDAWLIKRVREISG